MSAIVQGSPEWFSARLGKVTASRVSDLLAKTKSGYSTSRENYAIELALERITGARSEGFSNAAMAWGVEQEPLARAAYEATTGAMVEEVGLIDHPCIPMCAASPDGLIESDGMLEIKNPNSATHFRTLLSKRADPKYLNQIFWQLACSGRKWVDFVSYDSRMPEHAKLFVCRVHRDDALIAAMESEVIVFLGEVTAMVEQLNNMKQAA